MGEFDRFYNFIPHGEAQKAAMGLDVKDWVFFGEPPESLFDDMRIAMFETLMKNGSYRIDYLNRSAFGSMGAVALYICAGVQEDEAYSRMAKRQLLEGLNRVARDFGGHNLVAIYLDIRAADEIVRPAYKRMKEDLQAGIFHKVILSYSAELLEKERVH